MSETYLVSVIIPTKNSSEFLEACLGSIKNQSYLNTEVIVVDNSSSDDTKKIAKKYADVLLNKGNERSAQRNYGVARSRGKYILIVDSDMELTADVIDKCVMAMSKQHDVKGVIIPEESFGEGFWARCKALERSFYLGVDWMEAARFFRRTEYRKLGGYNEKLISGEDWDFSQRIESTGRLVRVSSFIRHNEGRLRLTTILSKKFYYAKQFSHYMNSAGKHHANIDKQTNILARYRLFVSRPGKLFNDPLVGLGMLIMKTGEFTMGGLGLLIAKVKASK